MAAHGSGGSAAMWRHVAGWVKSGNSGAMMGDVLHDVKLKDVKVSHVSSSNFVWTFCDLFI